MTLPKPQKHDYQLDDYDENERSYENSHKNDQPAAFSQDPDPDENQKSHGSNTSLVVLIFVFFAVTFLAVTFKRWRNLLLRWLLKCGDPTALPPGYNNPYNTYNAYSNRAYAGSRETLI